MNKEILEEAAERWFKEIGHNASFIKAIEFGAKWQQEKSYSEEEVKQMFNRYNEFIAHHEPEEWQLWIDKQFKKEDK